MATLALIRHGQSQWNKENRFTGWIDIPLSPEGEAEAHTCAKKLKNFKFDCAYTSALIRAQDTLKIILQDNNWDLPIKKDKAINERMYGDLQGKNKDEMRKIYGVEQVHVWRRSYDIAPPGGEALKDTAARAIPYFKKQILPQLKKGKNVIVSAHGNSLRAIVMFLDGLSKEEVLKLEIPTGVPYIYQISKSGQVEGKEILN